MKSGELVAGRYRLDARLGIGGMGEVWKATHATTGREYALKFMHAHAATSQTARQRFAREARVSAKINHPNVIDIYDAGDLDGGMLYLAMELLEGISLGDALHAEPPLSVQDLLTVMLDTSRALAAAHAVGVIHRDIKPANIFLHRDRATGFASAKILDFGISKFGGNDDENNTKTGAVLGSPRYMSPEQTRSAASVDSRADLWAAGVILFEALTGTWPHEGDSFSSLVVAICTTPPASIDEVAPHLPEPLRAVVRDCLQPLDRRIPSATALVERLTALLADPSLARTPLPRPLHAPSESVKTTTGVRVRPPALSSTNAPESLITTQARQSALPPVPTPPASLRFGAGPVSLADPSSNEATQVRAAPATLSAIPELEAQLAEVPPAYSMTAPFQALAGSSPGAPSPFHAQSPQAAPAPYPTQSPQAAPSPYLAQSSPPAPSPYLAQSSPPVPSPIPAQSPPAASPSKAPPTTMPLQAEMVRQIELASAAPDAPPPARGRQLTAVMAPPPGPPDPLVGTVSKISFDARPSALPPAMAPSQPAPPGPAAAPPLAPVPGPAKGLRMMLAALSVLLVGIVIALVSVLRSAPSGEPAAAHGSATATATPAVTAAPTAIATATPVATAPPAATAEPATAPAATHAPSASAAPDRGRPPPPPRAPARPAKGPGSKIKQLGSGLD
jgi:serine/threonine-protein kinase